MGLAPLQLMDHLLKNAGIIQRSTGGEHTHFICNSIACENLLCTVPGKMHPVHFCLLIPIIHIPLRLFGPVEHHMPGGYNRVRLVIIKVKMCNARSNVQQLEIHPSLGPVGRKLGPGIQMISSAASHNQRLALILKIHQRII